MPIRIPDNLPAFEELRNENIFVITDDRAYHQDIRPLEIVILNLMPTKIITETQLLRLIGNTPLQVNVTFIHPISHKSKNTPMEHLNTFYQNFTDIKDKRFDGMIITGAPVEQLPFEKVNYWDEFKEILNWSLTNVYSSLFICWASQAALYHFYGINKYTLENKVFGIFKHKINGEYIKLFRGFDDEFYAPHSRYTEIKKEDIIKNNNVDLLSDSDEAGAYIVASKNGRQTFITGHSEYDPLTLKTEYMRDVEKGLNIPVPKNYFPNDNPKCAPIVTWRSHANLLFHNWLNYYVYQETPFDLNKL